MLQENTITLLKRSEISSHLIKLPFDILLVNHHIHIITVDIQSFFCYDPSPTLSRTRLQKRGDYLWTQSCQVQLTKNSDPT